MTRNKMNTKLVSLILAADIESGFTDLPDFSPETETNQSNRT